MGLFNKIKKLNIFSGLFSVDEDFFEELEESLILSDMGMETTLEAVETLRERVKERKIKEPEEVKACLREILVEMLAVGEPGLDLSGKPAVILMIGVNGVGKTPFCVVDEIEAALDEANGARFIRYLRAVASETQFLLITHRRETMEAADVLYGVTMERQGVSRVLKLDLHQAEALLDGAPA